MSVRPKLVKRVSMLDVAQAAGVSPQTVSRVSSGAPYVSDEKRKRILKAMRELGYRPNAAARAMKSGEFRTIGVVYSSLHAVGYHRTLEAISDVAARKGYVTTLIPMEAGSQQESDGAFTRLGEVTMDALISIISSERPGDGSWEMPPLIPGVILGPPLFSDCSTVDFDQASGTRDAVELLLDLGHPTVHHISGPKDFYSARARRDVWAYTLSSRGITPPEVLHGDWSPNSGYLAFKALLEKVRPTAVFVANDQMALGVYRAAIEAGLRIPEDLSVIGFDNIDEAEAFPPPLTTVEQDWALIGQTALEEVLGLLQGGRPEHTTLPTRLIERASCAPPRG